MLVWMRKHDSTLKMEVNYSTLFLPLSVIMESFRCPREQGSNAEILSIICRCCFQLLNIFSRILFWTRIHLLLSYISNFIETNKWRGKSGKIRGQYRSVSFETLTASYLSQKGVKIVVQLSRIPRKLFLVEKLMTNFYCLLFSATKIDQT